MRLYYKPEETFEKYAESCSTFTIRLEKPNDNHETLNLRGFYKNKNKQTKNNNNNNNLHVYIFFRIIIIIINYFQMQSINKSIIYSAKFSGSFENNIRNIPI